MRADLIRQLYYRMLRIRRIEEGIAAHYPEQEMRCPVHLCIGQEAVAVGVCANLGPNDWVMSGHRSHGHYLAKGGNLNTMLAEIYGKETGCCRGRGGSMHLVDLEQGFLGATPIVAATIPIAVGAAFGSRMRGEERLVVTFFGEGATEEGAFHEAANFAVLKKLAALFVCENNLYSVYSPMSVRQPHGREIFRLAQGHGMEARQGDGNDVLQVHQLAGEAITQIRAGGGPIFLEFKTYRWREHCGPNYDNDIGYRTEEEFLYWKERCPLERARTLMKTQNLLAACESEEMEQAIRAEFADAMRFAKESPFPSGDRLFDHVYAGNGAS
jgi:TPP-dependent pyruvate/acetoin dehydrogenase alpha subunit